MKPANQPAIKKWTYLILGIILFGVGSLKSQVCDIGVSYDSCIYVNVPVKFNNTSTSQGTGSWLWFINSAQAGFAPDLTYTFSQTGTYTITLTRFNVNCGFPLPNKVFKVTVADSLNGGFVKEKNTLCSNTLVKLQSLISIKGGTKNYLYSWSTAKKGVILGANPSYSSLVADTLFLMLTDKFGCQIRDTSVVEIAQLPYLTFSSAVDTTCASTPVTFTVDSVLNNTTYFWDFNDNNASSNDTIASHSFSPISGTSFGNYIVKLTATNNTTGCSISVSKTINITPTPNPVLTGVDWNSSLNAFTYCGSSYNSPNHKFSFTNLTISNVSTHYMDSLYISWGDSAKTDTTFNLSSGSLMPTTLSFTYTKVDSFTIALKGYGKNGCIGAKKYKVYNDNRAYLGINTLSGLTGCSTHAMTFYSDNSSSAGPAKEQPSPTTKITWYFGDGITVKWDYNDYIANYDTTLKAAKIIHDFKQGSCGNSFKTAGNIIYNNSYYASLTMSNVCGNTGGADLYPITVCDKPNAAFSNDTICYAAGQNEVDFYNRSTEFCPDTSLLLANGNMPCYEKDSVKFVWLWGHGSQSDTTFSYIDTIKHNFPDSGAYTVTLLACNNCGCDTSSHDVFIYPLPSATFSNDTVCLGDLTSFMDLSKSNPASIGIKNYLWNYGDTGSVDSASNNRNPKHRFLKSGVFYTSLKVTDNYGCENSIIDTVVVDTVPLVIYTSNLICEGDTGVFTDGSNSSNGPITNRYWSLNGIIQDSSIVFKRYFPNCDTVSLDLRVIDTNLCSNSGTIDFPVYCLPTAIISLENNCLENTSIFNDSSISTNGPVQSWKWKFDVFDSSIQQHPTYQFSTSDTFRITLDIVDSIGCKNDTVIDLLIYPKPIPLFSSDTVCYLNPTSFLNLSAIDSNWYNPIKSYRWNFSDPSSNSDTSLLINPNYTYSKSGTYFPKLILVDTMLCTDTIIDTVLVKQLPSPRFTFIDVCEGDTAIFNSSSVSYNKGTASEEWLIQGKIVDSSSSINHVFDTCGTFPITLRVIDSSGCDSSITQLIRVYCLPVAKFTATKVCLGTQIAFLDKSLIGDTTIKNWIWNFGDGSGNSTNQNPSYTYTASGKYVVKQTVEDIFGCKSDTSDSAEVSPPPVFSLDNDTNFCEGQSYTIKGPDSMTSYSWNNASTAQSILVINSGSYILTVTDSNGCLHIDTIEVIIHANPKPNIGSDTTLCDGSNYLLRTLQPYNKYSWSPGGDTLRQITVSNQGIYKITVTDTNGCKWDTSVSVIYRNGLNVSLAAIGSMCLNDTILTLTGGTPSGGTYFINGVSATTYNPSIRGAGTDTVQYVLVDINSCTDTASVTIKVNPLPIVIASLDTSICKLDTATLLASGGTSYVWSDGSLTFGSNPYQVSPTNTTRYFVTVTDGNNCEDSASLTVRVNALPEPNVGPIITLCVGDSIKIGAKLGGSYLWSTNATTDSILVTPSQNTFYGVTMTDGNSCKGIDSVEVKVNPLPTVSAGSPVSICIGKSETITASGGTSYLWDDNSPNQSRTVSPVVTTNYFVTVTDGNGCEDSASVLVTVNTLPIAAASLDTSICKLDTATLLAS
ncbi:MAG: PKD domain-containing protein, partial [Salibacteraceae bacterium]|nr:PKD domain-containing protein [Salibacteraceae bacterium]